MEVSKESSNNLRKKGAEKEAKVQNGGKRRGGKKEKIDSSKEAKKDNSNNECSLLPLEKEVCEQVAPNRKNDLESPNELKKIIQEARERDERVQKHLGMLKEQARLVCGVEAPVSDKPKSNELASSISKCEKHFDNFKDTINNILEMTKQTQNEVQKTKDIVSNIQNDTTQNRICGSFHSKFMEDEDGEIFDDRNFAKSVDVDRPGMQSIHTPLITTNDEDGLSTIVRSNFSIEYTITNEDGLEGIEEDDGRTEQVNQFKYYQHYLT